MATLFLPFTFSMTDWSKLFGPFPQAKFCLGSAAYVFQGLDNTIVRGKSGL